MAEQFFQTCVCGCSFCCVSDFTKHERGCTKGKKRLSGVLSKAREVYQRKKLRTGLKDAQPECVVDDDVSSHPEPVRTRIFLSNLVVLTEVIQPSIGSADHDGNNSHTASVCVSIITWSYSD